MGKITRQCPNCQTELTDEAENFCFPIKCQQCREVNVFQSISTADEGKGELSGDSMAGLRVLLAGIIVVVGGFVAKSKGCSRTLKKHMQHNTSSFKLNRALSRPVGNYIRKKHDEDKNE